MHCANSAARRGRRRGMMLAGTAVAIVAGLGGAAAEDWEQRLSELAAGAEPKLEIGTLQLAQEAEPEPAEGEEPVLLGPVRVEGEGENATGPIDGYVARDSLTG